MSTRLHPTISAILAVALAGCGAAPAATPPPPAPRPAPPPEPAWATVAVHEYGTTDFVIPLEAPPDPIHVTSGSIRALISGDHVEISPDVPFDPIVGATRIADHWFFLTWHGAVLRSDTFTSELQVVAPMIGDSFDRPLPGRGALVALRRGDLLRAGPWGHAWVRSADVGPIVDATFVSEHDGVVLVAPGRLLRTRDGASFEAVDLGGRGPLRVWPRAGGYLIETDGGDLALGVHGPPRPIADEPTRRELPDEAADVLDVAVRALQPNAFSAWAHGPGGHLTMALNPLDFIETPMQWTPERGAQTLPRPPWPGQDLEPLDDDPFECFHSAWGAKVLATCDQDQRRLFVLEEGEWRGLGAVAPAVHDWYPIAARDGSAIVSQGRCGPARDEEGVDGFFCWMDGAVQRQGSIDRDALVVDVSVDRVLLRIPDDRLERALEALHSPETFDFWIASGTGRGAERPVRAPRDVGVLQLAFDASGLLHGIGLEGEEQRAVALIERGATLHAHPLPPGTTRFEMADGRHGVASGRTYADVHVTQDGGRTFRRLSPPMAGPTSLTIEGALYDPHDRNPFLRCGLTACRVGYLWLWGQPALTSDRPGAPGRMLFLGGALESDDPLEPTPFALDGRRTGGVYECAAPLADDPFEDRERFGTAGGIELDRRSRDSGAIVWSFHDGRREFEARSATLVGRAWHELDAQPEVMALLSTPRMLVFSHCVLPDPAPMDDPDLTCLPHVVARDGVPRALRLLPDAAGAVGPSLRSALPLSGGGAAVWFDVGEVGDRVVEVVIELDRDGAEVRRRTYVFPLEAGEHLLAVDRHGPGLAVGVGEGLVVHPVDPTRPAAPIGPLPDGPLPGCRGASRGATRVALTAHVGPAISIGGDRIPSMAAVVRVAPDACLEGFTPLPLRYERPLGALLGGHPQVIVSPDGDVSMRLIGGARDRERFDCPLSD